MKEYDTQENVIRLYERKTKKQAEEIAE